MRSIAQKRLQIIGEMWKERERVDMREMVMKVMAVTVREGSWEEVVGLFFWLRHVLFFEKVGLSIDQKCFCVENKYFYGF
jgi:hypothetical protein